MKKENERRCIANRVEYRSQEENEETVGTLVGYAAVFNSRTDIGPFTEEILPGAFDDLAEFNTAALFNHDQSQLLGRLQSRTLRLSTDDHGLRYEIDLPNTTLGRDIAELAKRGDISQASFSFRVSTDGDAWEERTGEKPSRTINQFEKLYDVSPVTFPAYNDTETSVRALDLYRKEQSNQTADMQRRKMQLEIEEERFI